MADKVAAMSSMRILVLAALFGLAACASPPPPAPAGLNMPAPDEAGAASLLAGYLLARGWTVRLPGEGLVEAEQAGERVVLEPMLDPAGVDRLLVTRTWAAASSAGTPELEALALRLNAALNVGQFRAVPGGLAFQSSLPFLGTLDPRLLDAFLQFGAEVRLAVLMVEGAAELLAPVEDEPPGR